ncbi:MAG TPA: phosphodiester glycosidase family protein [Streptosporangiaceae bacterium]
MRHANRTLLAPAAAVVLAIAAAPAANAAPGPGIAGSDPVRDVTVAAPPRPAVRAASDLAFTGTTRIAPGVDYRTFTTTAAAGPVQGYLLDADLRRASVGLLHPADVGARATVSAMTNAQRGVAGVNGDFFNISETHAGVVPTGSSVGPEVSGGRDLKAAVPDGQRFGPALTSGATDEDVLGVGGDRTAHLASLRLTGTVRAGRTELAVRGLNQYALPVGGVGAFTHDWGAVSRLRAVCGTDTDRTAACGADTAEAVVRHGVVTAVGDAVGAGAIPRGTTVLVGREGGTDRLRTLRPGAHVRIAYRLTGAERFRFAIGGLPIRRGGAAVPGLETTGAAPRTAAGIGSGGHRLSLMVIDGRSAASPGVTLAELSALLAAVGADDGVNLDGGGSSAVAVRGPGDAAATVRNVPSDGTERAVANGIGVFTPGWPRTP